MLTDFGQRNHPVVYISSFHDHHWVTFSVNITKNLLLIVNMDNLGVHFLHLMKSMINLGVHFLHLMNTSSLYNLNMYIKDNSTFSSPLQCTLYTSLTVFMT